jgi:hypothetical protein
MAQVFRTRQELIDDLLKLDRDYAALLSSCSREQLKWCPATDAWSVAQCIQHVMRVNSVYLPPIRAAIAKGRPSTASEGEPLRTAGWFSSMFLKSVSPQGKAKLPSPRIGRPSAEPSDINSEDALQALLGTQQEIREILTARNQRDLNRLRFKNPFVPVLRFTVGTGILIMVAHAQRHFLQAERVCRMENFPKVQSAGRIA